MAELNVLCDICGARPAKHVCRICGRRVCDEHFDKVAGICTSCKRARHASEAQRK